MRKIALFWPSLYQDCNNAAIQDVLGQYLTFVHGGWGAISSPLQENMRSTGAELAATRKILLNVDTGVERSDCAQRLSSVHAMRVPSVFKKYSILPYIAICNLSQSQIESSFGFAHH